MKTADRLCSRFLTARCPDSGAFGIAISSSSPAVAARCVHRLWALWQPQREDYITRGPHPASTPAYGEAGDQ